MTLPVEQTHALVGVGQILFADSRNRVLTAESTPNGSEFSLADLETEDQFWLAEESVDALPVTRVGPDRFAFAARGRPGGDRVEVRRIADFSLTDEFDAGPVAALAADPHGNRIATADGHGGVTLWDLQTRHRVGQPIAADSGIEQVVFSAHGGWLAARDMSFEVFVNRVEGERSEARRLHISDGFPLAFHPGKPWLAVDVGPAIAIYEVEGLSLLRQIALPREFQASEMRISPNGSLLLVGSYGKGRLDLWSFDSGEHILHVGELGGHAFSLDFHPGGNRFAACRSDAGAVFSLL